MRWPFEDRILLIGYVGVVLVVFLSSPSPVVRYHCTVTVHDEILCFEPGNGRMFRPERRFDQFTLEVP